MNALDVLCAQLTRDLFAIAKFLLSGQMDGQSVFKVHALQFRSRQYSGAPRIIHGEVRHPAEEMN